MNDWTDRILTSFAAEVREDVQGLLEPKHPLLRQCESPIERAFGAAFMMVHGYFRGRPELSSEWEWSGAAPRQFLTPQFEASPYRVDFVIGWNRPHHRFTSIVVECDGHDFHEKTKQQAARDKARDRFLSEEFARVLRFTGSEIWKDPCGCAVQAYSLSDQLFWDYELRAEPE